MWKRSSNRIASWALAMPQVTSVNVVEIPAASEVAIGQAALGGSLRASLSAWGESSLAMASSCM